MIENQGKKALKVEFRKKNRNIFRKYWIFFKRTLILSALFGMFLPALNAEDNMQNRKIAKLQAEIRRLNAENAGLKKTIERLKEASTEGSVLRKELIETLDKYSTQAGRLKRMEMSAAGTIETLEPVYMGAREMNLEADLKVCADSIGQLSVAILRYCDEISAVLPQIISNNVEAAKMRLKLESLREQALKAALLASPAKAPENFEQCRIAELNAMPELVILSAGYRNGVRMGLMLKVGKVTLKVIAIRSFVSAAVVVKGEFRDLAPGMEAMPAGRGES